MGRIHEGPVGPHPLGSCQLSVPQDKFLAVMNFLMAERGDLNVFFHAVTGDDYRDHTQMTGWLGRSLSLNLSIFREEPTPPPFRLDDEDSYLPPHTD